MSSANLPGPGSLAKQLAALIRLLPRNGVADLFTSAFLVGLGFTFGLAIALWIIDNAPRILELPLD